MAPFKIIQVSAVFTATKQASVKEILKSNDTLDASQRINFTSADVIVFHSIYGVRDFHLQNEKKEELLPKFKSFRGGKVSSSDSKTVVFVRKALMQMAGFKAEKLWKHNEVMGVKLKFTNKSTLILTGLSLEHGFLNTDKNDIHPILLNQLEKTVKQVVQENVIIHGFIGNVKMGKRGDSSATDEGLKARIYHNHFAKDLKYFLCSEQKNDAFDNDEIITVLANANALSSFDPIVSTAKTVPIGRLNASVLEILLLNQTGIAEVDV